MLKTRSVDVRKPPAEVFRETVDALVAAGLAVQESVWLTPYHQDHAAIVCTKPDGGDSMSNGVRLYSAGPLSIIALILLIGLVILVIPLLFLGLVGAAFTRLGFSWIAALAVVLLMLFGSFINIPLYTIRRE